MIAIDMSKQGSERVIRFLELLGDAPEGRELRNLIGHDVGALTRDHLYAKDRKPNRLGGRKTHYYRAAGDSVNHDITKRGVGVNVDHIGIRQRLEGGVITPKTAKALTIPVSPRAHGKRAREFDDTFILDKSNSGDPATVGVIVQDMGGDRLDALFVLRTRVEQSPDPTVLPNSRTIMQTATQTILTFLDRLRAF